jgi:adenine-specific DNA-methyltransferase
MRTNLLGNLKTLLQKDERLTSGGEFLKNKIIELALKLDKELIKLLLSDKKMKQVFFVDVDRALIFDKDKFLRFVSNKQFLPDSYTAFKNKIGLTAEDEYLSEKKEVVLSWPYKDCVLEGGITIEDQKRNEIFWNEILAPDDISRLFDAKVFTNAKRIDKKGEHKLDKFRTDKNGNIKDNLIIKGNNLLALHSLKERFAGKVKLIYIDPPYNRDVDSFYNDTFKHSSWLTFMKNRLEIAKELLDDQSGVLLVQISDAEHGYLGVLCDEVFNKENFVNHVTVRTRSPSGFKTVNVGVFESAEYILIYAKNKKNLKYEQQYEASAYDENYNNYVENIEDPPDKWRIRPLIDVVLEELKLSSKKEALKKLGKHTLKSITGEFALNHAGQIFRYTEINVDAGKETLEAKKKSLKNPIQIIVVKREKYDDRLILNGKEISFYSKKIKEINGVKQPTILLTNIWTDISWEGIAKEGEVTLKKGKKPEKLIKRMLEMYISKEDLILDFFAGTGTTCAVAHKMGPQYIGIEQLDYGKNSAEMRLKNVIKGDQTGISKSVGWKEGGDFVYLELMKWNENFVEKIQKAKSKVELKKLWETMKKKAFLSYKVDPKVVDKNAKDFADLSIEDQKRFLLECLDRNHLYVNYSEVDDEEYGVSDEEKRLNKGFYAQK